MKTAPAPHSDLAEEIAFFRYGLIADVVRLEPGSAGIYAQLRERASQPYDIPGSSKRRVAAETMRAWVKSYRKRGFAGLYPKPRSDRGRPRNIAPEVVDLLLHAKEESPALTATALRNSLIDFLADSAHTPKLKKFLLENTDPTRMPEFRVAA